MMQIISHVQNNPNNTFYNLNFFHNHGSIIGSPCYISFNKYSILGKGDKYGVHVNQMTTFNSNDVGIGLYEFLCKKFHMSLLHDNFDCMVIPGPFQRTIQK
jgi:hypothetical protein